MKNPKSPKSGIITVENIRQASNKYWRRNVIERFNIRGSDDRINDLMNLKCEWKSRKCFISYGGGCKVKAMRFNSDYIQYAHILKI